MSAAAAALPTAYVQQLSSLARFTTPQVLSILERRRAFKAELLATGQLERNSVEYRGHQRGIAAAVEVLQGRGVTV